MKPSDIARELPFFIEARRPVFIWGPSGAGKSSVVHQIAKAMKRKVNDARLSQLDSIDLKGFPVPDTKTKTMQWLAPDFLPRPNDPPGILFLDECNSALPAVASAAYQLILDLRLGEYVLPPHWSIVAAGNNASDRGVTHQMPAPLNNRFVHIDFEIDNDDWQTRAAQDGIHAHIRSYLRFKTSAIHTFDPVKNPRSFATPRSWYFASEILERNRPPAVQFELLKGTIGEGEAAELTGYISKLKDMPDIDLIMSAPESAPLPNSQPITHAVITTLVDKATMKTFDKLMKYVSRLQPEFQLVFVRSTHKKEKGIVNTGTYRDWALRNQEVLL